MQIKLYDTTELQVLNILGQQSSLRGTMRDSLSFIFDSSYSLDTINELFTANNCQSIIITNDQEQQYTHTGYTERVCLKLEPKEIKKATATEPAVYENRIIVTMALKSYEEQQIAGMQAQLEALKANAEKAAAYDILTGGAQ